MNAVLKTQYDEALNALASCYVRDGFDVLIQPSAHQLPFELGGYRPDLVAVKGETHLIIDVKPSAARISIDRLQALAQDIAQHAGWRFLLVTLDDVDAKTIPTTEVELPTWRELGEKMKRVDSLLEQGAFEPALLYLWSIFEAALRKRAISQSIPVERLPASMLLKHMYSQGEVSVEKIDLFLAFMQKRNRLAHGANEVIDTAFARALAMSIAALLTDWQAGAA
jgi:hypothetical protein